MKSKAIKILVAVCTMLGLGAALVTPTYADPSKTICNMEGVSDEVRAAAGCGGADEAAGSFGAAIGNIITAIVSILGVIAVIVIVIGGVNYMTSGGDSTKLKKAKDTILYACIGLAICALAFAITQFAIGAINDPTTTPTPTS